MFEANANKQFNTKYSGYQGEVSMGAFTVIRRIFKGREITGYLLSDNISRKIFIMTQVQFKKFCDDFKLKLERTSNITIQKEDNIKVNTQIGAKSMRAVIGDGYVDTVIWEQSKTTNDQYTNYLNKLYISQLQGMPIIFTHGMNFTHYEVAIKAMRSNYADYIVKAFNTYGAIVRQGLSRKKINAEEYEVLLLAIAYLGNNSITTDDYKKLAQLTTGAKGLRILLSNLVNENKNKQSTPNEVKPQLEPSVYGVPISVLQKFCAESKQNFGIVWEIGEFGATSFIHENEFLKTTILKYLVLYVTWGMRSDVKIFQLVCDDGGVRIGDNKYDTVEKALENTNLKMKYIKKNEHMLSKIDYRVAINCIRQERDLDKSGVYEVSINTLLKFCAESKQNFGMVWEIGEFGLDSSINECEFLKTNVLGSITLYVTWNEKGNRPKAFRIVCNETTTSVSKRDYDTVAEVLDEANSKMKYIKNNDYMLSTLAISDAVEAITCERNLNTEPVSDIGTDASDKLYGITLSILQEFCTESKNNFNIDWALGEFGDIRKIGGNAFLMTNILACITLYIRSIGTGKYIIMAIGHRKTTTIGREHGYNTVREILDTATLKMRYIKNNETALANMEFEDTCKCISNESNLTNSTTETKDNIYGIPTSILIMLTDEYRNKYGILCGYGEFGDKLKVGGNVFLEAHVSDDKTISLIGSKDGYGIVVTGRGKLKTLGSIHRYTTSKDVMNKATSLMLYIEKYRTRLKGMKFDNLCECLLEERDLSELDKNSTAEPVSNNQFSKFNKALTDAKLAEEAKLKNTIYGIPISLLDKFCTGSKESFGVIWKYSEFGDTTGVGENTFIVTTVLNDIIISLLSKQKSGYRIVLTTNRKFKMVGDADRFESPMEVLNKAISIMKYIKKNESRLLNFDSVIICEYISKEQNMDIIEQRLKDLKAAQESKMREISEATEKNSRESEERIKRQEKKLENAARKKISSEIYGIPIEELKRYSDVDKDLYRMTWEYGEFGDTFGIGGNTFLKADILIYKTISIVNCVSGGYGIVLSRDESEEAAETIGRVDEYSTVDDVLARVNKIIRSVNEKDFKSILQDMTIHDICESFSDDRNLTMYGVPVRELDDFCSESKRKFGIEWEINNFDDKGSIQEVGGNAFLEAWKTFGDTKMYIVSYGGNDQYGIIALNKWKFILISDGKYQKAYEAMDEALLIMNYIRENKEKLDYMDAEDACDCIIDRKNLGESDEGSGYGSYRGRY